MSPFLAAIAYPPIDPVALDLGPLAIRWYGLAYLAGFVAALFVLRKLSASGRLGITRSAVTDLLGWLILGVIAGGRIGWWLFYDRSRESGPWYEVFALWNGGMSFHGGLIGVAIALALWAWWTKSSFWHLADGLALVTPIGLFLGRLANFVNAELVGRVTDVPWAVIFPGDTVGRHPSQLYEAILEGPILGLLLWRLFRRHPQSPGLIAATFLVAYATFRFLVEFVRQPDEQLGFIALSWLTMGQLLSLALWIAGVAVLWLKRPKLHHKSASKT